MSAPDIAAKEDFRTWWSAAEFFGGDGCMAAAELAWDHQQEKIDALTARIKEAKDEHPR